MSARRSERKKKENPRYPGSSKYSQEQGEEEAEEPPDPDEVPGLRQQATIEEEDDNNNIRENLDDSVTSSAAGLELAAVSTPEQDGAPGEELEEVEHEEMTRRLRRLRSESLTPTTAAPSPHAAGLAVIQVRELQNALDLAFGNAFENARNATDHPAEEEEDLPDPHEEDGVISDGDDDVPEERFLLGDRALPNLPQAVPGAGEEEGWQAVDRLGPG